MTIMITHDNHNNNNNINDNNDNSDNDNNKVICYHHELNTLPVPEQKVKLS